MIVGKRNEYTSVQAKTYNKWWFSEESEQWNPIHFQCRANVPVNGSRRGVAGTYAACGWAAVQLDLNENGEPWSAMYGTMPVQHEVQ